jgi:hypothetical protein
MKVVQTPLTEEEHKLLEEYARRKSKNIKEVLREAVRNVVEGRVVPDDPVFSMPPSSKRTGKRDNGSVEHDRHLYGATPRSSSTPARGTQQK